MSRLGSPTTTAINNILAQFAYNNEIVSGDTTYVFRSDADGNYLIQKFVEGGNPIAGHATIKNNPTVTTYADAVTNYLTLTYGLYHQAF
jgi:hypothetical protein